VEIVLAVVMVLLGHATHLIKKTVEARQEGYQGGVLHLVKERPYRTIMGVCASAAAMGWLIETDQVTAMTAFTIGYMADSALALVRSGSEARLQ
jgi:hypothetical protein